MHLSDDEADSNLMSLSKPELFAMTSGIKSLIVQCFTPLCGTLFYTFAWKVSLDFSNVTKCRIRQKGGKENYPVSKRTTIRLFG